MLVKLFAKKLNLFLKEFGMKSINEQFKRNCELTFKQEVANCLKNIVEETLVVVGNWQELVMRAQDDDIKNITTLNLASTFGRADCLVKNMGDINHCWKALMSICSISAGEMYFILILVSRIFRLYLKRVGLLLMLLEIIGNTFTGCWNKLATVLQPRLRNQRL